MTPLPKYPCPSSVPWTDPNPVHESERETRIYCEQGDRGHWGTRCGAKTLAQYERERLAVRDERRAIRAAR